MILGWEISNPWNRTRIGGGEAGTWGREWGSGFVDWGGIFACVCNYNQINSVLSCLDSSLMYISTCRISGSSLCVIKP